MRPRRRGKDWGLRSRAAARSACTARPAEAAGPESGAPQARAEIALRPRGAPGRARRLEGPIQLPGHNCKPKERAGALRICSLAEPGAPTCGQSLEPLVELLSISSSSTMSAAREGGALGGAQRRCKASKHWLCGSGGG